MGKWEELRLLRILLKGPEVKISNLWMNVIAAANTSLEFYSIQTSSTFMITFVLY